MYLFIYPTINLSCLNAFVKIKNEWGPAWKIPQADKPSLVYALEIISKS